MNSFRWAMRGLLQTIREERNMRVHLCLLFYVVLGGVLLGLTREDWYAVLLCSGLVMGMECMNTALEALCDRVDPNYHPLIGKAKDAAAGGVLIAALVSLAIGCLVFLSDGRPALARQLLAAHPWLAAIIVLPLPLWIYFIVRRSKK